MKLCFYSIKERLNTQRYRITLLIRAALKPEILALKKTNKTNKSSKQN